MELCPKRKPNRLKMINYNENGAYFITICSANKACIFWTSPVGAAFRRPPFPPTQAI